MKAKNRGDLIVTSSWDGLCAWERGVNAAIGTLGMAVNAICQTGINPG